MCLSLFYDGAAESADLILYAAFDQNEESTKLIKQLLHVNCVSLTFGLHTIQYLLLRAVLAVLLIRILVLLS